MKILVIIPCYNEAENIAGVVHRLRKACPEADYVVVTTAPPTRAFRC